MNEIIPQPIQNQQQQPWQSALRSLITCPQALLRFVEVDETAISWALSDFPLRVTQSFAMRMRKGDPDDPLLKQVLSLKSENELFSGFCPHPLQEQTASPLPGLLHKYYSRILIIFTSSCAIHCRYCFRRHFPYQDNNVGRHWDPILEYIEGKPQIEEVILSGGDPLMASNETLALFLQKLSNIPHVKTVRFHTRLPIVIPQRIEPELLKVLNTNRFQFVMIYHINHPNEIVPEIVEGVRLLKLHQVTVFNASVLLAGVNDDAPILIELSKALFKAGILPYYINLLDKVQGAHEFRVPIEKARALQTSLRQALSGYLVPKFVQEIPEQQFKTPLDLYQE